MTAYTDYLQGLVTQIAGTIGVPSSIALQLVNIESNFNTAAVGTSGEYGLTQLMPATAQGLGVNRYNVAENITGGLTYLKQQYDATGNWYQALRQYNGGPNVKPGNTMATRYANQYTLPTANTNQSQTPSSGGLAAMAAKLLPNAVQPTGLAGTKATPEAPNALAGWLNNNGFPTLGMLATGTNFALLVFIIVVSWLSVINIFKE